jgi:hypothetical protein
VGDIRSGRTGPTSGCPCGSVEAARAQHRQRPLSARCVSRRSSNWPWTRRSAPARPDSRQPPADVGVAQLGDQAHDGELAIAARGQRPRRHQPRLAVTLAQLAPRRRLLHGQFVTALPASDPQPVLDDRSGALAAPLHHVVREMLGEHARTRSPVVPEYRPHRLHRRADGALDLHRHSACEPCLRRPDGASWIGLHRLHSSRPNDPPTTLPRNEPGVGPARRAHPSWETKAIADESRAVRRHRRRAAPPAASSNDGGRRSSQRPIRSRQLSCR